MMTALMALAAGTTTYQSLGWFASAQMRADEMIAVVHRIKKESADGTRIIAHWQDNPAVSANANLYNTSAATYDLDGRCTRYDFISRDINGNIVMQLRALPNGEALVGTIHGNFPDKPWRFELRNHLVPDEVTAFHLLAEGKSALVPAVLPKLTNPVYAIRLLPTDSKPLNARVRGVGGTYTIQATKAVTVASKGTSAIGKGISGIFDSSRALQGYLMPDALGLSGSAFAQVNISTGNKGFNESQLWPGNNGFLFPIESRHFDKAAIAAELTELGID